MSYWYSITQERGLEPHYASNILMKICHDIFGCLHQQNRDTKPTMDSCEQFVCNRIIFDLHNYVMMEVGPLGSFPCLYFSIYA